MLDLAVDPGCFLVRHGIFERGSTPCEGRLRRVHLVPQQLLKQKKVADLWDPIWWVWGCGGFDYGNDGHHGQFDASRTLRLPRVVIPIKTVEAAERIGLGWYIDKTYKE